MKKYFVKVPKVFVSEDESFTRRLVVMLATGTLLDIRLDENEYEYEFVAANPLSEFRVESADQGASPNVWMTTGGLDWRGTHTMPNGVVVTTEQDESDE